MLERETPEDRERNLKGLCCMLLAFYRDKPGVLSGILSLLSSADINVANCHLGRRWISRPTWEEQGEGALERDGSDVPRWAPAAHSELLGMCIFHTDNAVEESLIEKIRELDFVREAMLFATPCTLGQTRFA